jgi:pimeloyl-ACP methyl ester carboxylesterase
MCWSRIRIYDRLYLDCLDDINAAADRLKDRGASAIVVLGMSLGGNGALGYGARHAGLKGVITLVPGHAPEFINRRPEIAASLEHARTLIAAGQGNVRTAFADVNTRTTSFNFEVTTTPNIYVSFFAPDSPAVMPANAARLTAPLLYVAATNDPTQRGRSYIFDRAPGNPLNRYVTVSTNHIGTPNASDNIVVNWLEALAGQ